MTPNNTDSIHSICQAKKCEDHASRTVLSDKGHPHEEWKLCADHYEEMNGTDPWNGEQEWVPKKLYYRCPNGGKISHNVILREEDKGGYSCPCGKKHLPVSISD